MAIFQFKSLINLYIHKQKLLTHFEDTPQKKKISFLFPVGPLQIFTQFISWLTGEKLMGEKRQKQICVSVAGKL